ncbi:MAG: hypothetical protein ACREP4_06580 [Stenotrophomonas sp.]|uniref:hypothetical protein n=1 Tax=Stenotrophomonas sp. TaxID=69392 RepID=UPI003D6C8F40
MKDIYERQGFAPNQVPVNEQTLPTAQSVERIRKDIERMTGRPMETRTPTQEDGQA